MNVGRRGIIEGRGIGVAVALFCLITPYAWLWSVGSSGEELVKARNGMLLEVGKPADFTWVPGQEPRDFLVDRQGVPDEFLRAAAAAGFRTSGEATAGFAEGLEIARFLTGTGPRQGGAIRSDNLTVLRGIVEQKQGYCADFTQTFLGLAEIRGLPAREWGISFSAFGAGHAFNEVYDSDLRQWVLVDSFHSLYFVDPGTDRPLSVTETHDRLLADTPEKPIALRKIVPERFPFPSEAVALEYYRRGMPQLTLTWGRNVFDYERSPLVRVTSKLPRAGEQALAIAGGVFPKSKIYPVNMSDRDLREVLRARDRMVLAACAAALGTVLAFLQLLALLRNSRAARARATR